MRTPRGCTGAVMAPMEDAVDRYSRVDRDAGFVGLTPDSKFMGSLLQGREPLVGLFVVGTGVMGRVWYRRRARL